MKDKSACLVDKTNNCYDFECLNPSVGRREVVTLGEVRGRSTGKGEIEAQAINKNKITKSKVKIWCRAQDKGEKQYLGKH